MSGIFWNGMGSPFTDNNYRPFKKKIRVIKVLNEGAEAKIDKCGARTLWVRVSTSFFSGTSSFSKAMQYSGVGSTIQYSDL